MIHDIADAPDSLICQADKLAGSAKHITRNVSVDRHLLAEMRRRAQIERKQGDKRYKIWLLEDAGELIGAASISPEMDGSRFGLWIAPEHRGKGHADKLFQTAAAEYGKLYIDNIEEREFYSRHLALMRVCRRDGRHAFML